ncbi:hypothetical protein SU48_00485 [Deinococcus puniceus]|uniref:ABM domain-containing protein n=1 Tax=Deinococcus puniceus TaxID=1182568 RepID=A0A172TCN3_9DEIO|nr:hypothetical protein SU48_00485 [Deinococcus puniceus]
MEARDNGDGLTSAALSAHLNLLQTQPGFVGAELLVSPAQPGLLLIASRWACPAPQLALPAGAKSWVFEVQESRGAVSGEWEGRGGR